MTAVESLNPFHGVMDYMRRQRDIEHIGHLGFSAYGAIRCMRRFLEIYEGDMEFCQLQINYLDWGFQDARSKIALLDEYDIPALAMKPVRGSRLANLSENHVSAFGWLCPDKSFRHGPSASLGTSRRFL